MSLDAMLAIAMQHNPEVRAAQAQVHAAEAERDRSRLAVVQKIIAFREKWQTQHGAVRTAELEAANAKRLIALAKSGVVAGQRADLAKASLQKYAIEQARLAELNAELPFLLGQAPNERPQPPTFAKRKVIENTLLPKARQLVELQTRAHQSGEASLRDLIPAHRQVVELQIRLADTVADRVKVIEAHRALLQQVRNLVEASYRAGQATQADVLAAEIELAKTELWLLDIKGE
jgi:outer membrane protein TolC